MHTFIDKAVADFRSASIKGYVKVTSLVRDHSTLLLALVGVCILTAGLAELSLAQSRGGFGAANSSFSETSYDDSLVRGAVGNLFLLIEGPFGALIMVVSGLGAIVAAAMGAYRAAVGMLVVAVGAFILRSLVSLFFGTDFEAPGNSGTGFGG